MTNDDCEKWKKYRPLQLHLEQGLKLDEISIQRLKEQITPSFLIENGINRYPHDYPTLKSYLHILYTKKSSEQITFNYRDQLEYISDISFITAIKLLPRFRKFVASYRIKYNIDPNKLLNDLGFSKEQVGIATYAAHKGQTDVLMNQLGLLNEIEEKHRLADQLEKFEMALSRRFISLDTYLKPSNGIEQFKVPIHQLVHIKNFVFYGVETGKLLSTIGQSGHAGREWNKRLKRKGIIGGREYYSFLWSWKYYYHRVYMKEKNIRKLRTRLHSKFGFPLSHRKQDYSMKKRYENLFLK